MRHLLVILALALGTLLSPATLLAQSAYEEGKQLLAAGQFPAALARLQEAFAADPENLDISFFLGRAAMEAGDFETAATAFERILTDARVA